MKPELEQISLNAIQRSFQFFKRSDTSFLPFWHYHPELELTLITKGEGTRFVGDSIQSFTNFDLVLIGENIPHHWVSSTTINNQEAYVFQFNKSIFKAFPECHEFIALFNAAKQGVYFSAPSKQLIKQIIEFEHLNSISKLSALIQILHLLLLDPSKEPLISQAYSNSLSIDRSQTKISKTTNYIIEHLNEKLSINRMAEYTHMVPQSFCRWFKKHSGHSFINFVNKTRIENACQALLTSTDPVQEIAFNSGFESLSHFNRTFKRLKGVSPRVFRNQQT